SGRAPDRMLDRARSWLHSAVPQNHHPMARDIEEWLRLLALGQDPGSPPAIWHAGRSLLIHTFAAACGRFDSAVLLAEVEAAYRATSNGRLRQRQQVVLLSAELLARSHQEAAGHLHLLDS